MLISQNWGIFHISKSVVKSAKRTRSCCFSKLNSEIWSYFNMASVKVSSIGGIPPFCDFSGSQFLLITTFKRRSLFWIWHYLISLGRFILFIAMHWPEFLAQSLHSERKNVSTLAWNFRCLMFQCRNKPSVTWKLKSSRFPSRQVALCPQRKPYVISLSKVRADLIFCLVLIKQLFRYLISHNQVEEKRKKKW